MLWISSSVLFGFMGNTFALCTHFNTLLANTGDFRERNVFFLAWCHSAHVMISTINVSKESENYSSMRNCGTNIGGRLVFLNWMEHSQIQHKICSSLCHHEIFGLGGSSSVNGAYGIHWESQWGGGRFAVSGKLVTAPFVVKANTPIMRHCRTEDSPNDRACYIQSVGGGGHWMLATSESSMALLQFWSLFGEWKFEYLQQIQSSHPSKNGIWGIT